MAVPSRAYTGFRLYLRREGKPGGGLYIARDKREREMWKRPSNLKSPKPRTDGSLIPI